MRSGFLVSMVWLSLCGAAVAQPTTRAVLDAVTDRAELNLLRRQNERQREEIAELKLQVQDLRSRLESFGLSSAGTPTTGESVAAIPRRIVFIRLSGSHAVAGDIVTAIDALTPDQYFNVFTPGTNSAMPFAPQFVPATALNKQKIRETITPNTYVLSSSWEACVEAAAKSRPDVIWLIGNVRVGDEDTSIATLKKLLAGYSTRVNTIATMGTSLEARHLLWRMASETGGRCVGPDGATMDEPALPVRPTRAPAPATRPSILRDD